MFNFYLASFDPMHYGHLYVYETAKKQLGHVEIIVCQNALKDFGMFTIVERQGIIMEDYGIKSVSSATTIQEIKSIIAKADKIIRGVRTNQDHEYINKLLHHYESTEYAHKLFTIDNPPEFSFISATKLKNCVLNENVNEALRYAPASVIKKIQEKISSSKNISDK